jgi:hypothetical protein
MGLKCTILSQFNFRLVFVNNARELREFFFDIVNNQNATTLMLNDKTFESFLYAMQCNDDGYY